MTAARTFNPDTVPRRCMEARMRKFRGTLFIANASLAFELDEVAEFIFRQLDGRKTVREIGELLAGDYDVSVEQATADIAELLDELAENGMVEVNRS